MYTIVQVGHPALHAPAAAIAPEDIQGEKIQRLIAEMSLLLRKEELGVALAAPQVGESVRLFVVSGRIFQEHDEEGKLVGEAGPDLAFINPEIVRTSRGTKNMHEGCLSLRGKWGLVPRAEKVSLRALNEHGQLVTRNASGLLAHIFQHEVDHLDGIIYTEKAHDIYDDEEVSAAHSE